MTASALLKGLTSNHVCDFFCLNCLHSLITESKIKFHEKVCKNKDFCGIVISSQSNNVLKFNQYIKSDKIPYIICWPWIFDSKINGCANNSEKSSTTKVGERVPCGYSMSTRWAFDSLETKHT